MPIRRTVAWVHQAVSHNAEQLDAFESLLEGAELALAAAQRSPGSCALVVEAMLRPRVEASRSLAEHAREGLRMVEHLVLSGVCAYCYPEDPEAEFRVTSQDGQAARQLSTLVAMMEAIQLRLAASDAELVAQDPDGDCVPGYFTVLLVGADVSSGVGASLLAIGDGGLSSLDDASARAFSAGVEAVVNLRIWPFERRLRDSALALEAPAYVDQDFIEVSERLMGSVIAPAARMVHQTQTITLAFQLPRSELATNPAALLLWESTSASAAGAFPAPDVVGEEVVEEDLPSSVAGDPGAAFGLIVLISNRTAADKVDHMLVLVEGPRTLFLEDVCGSAVEALGYDCHGGGPNQDRCLRPTHATRLSAATAAWPPERRPRVAWRRHAATQSIAQSAWSLAVSYWGKHATASIADLRPAGACKGGGPLADAVVRVEGAQLKVLRAPEELFGLDTTLWSDDVWGGEDDDGLAAGVGKASAGAASRSKGASFAEALAEYVRFHSEAVATLAATKEAGKAPPEDIRLLVYSCQPFNQCGGIGDRVNGVITAFLLAVLSRRVFLIDSESPVPLQMLWMPTQIDWRVRGSLGATAGLRHHSYHDKRRNFEADIASLAGYSDRVLVVSKNYRMLRSLFEAPVFSGSAAAMGLPLEAPAFFAARLFGALFRPAPAVARELAHLRASLGGLEDRRFIAIHLRTGNIAWDPGRHGKEELDDFMKCAALAEEELAASSSPSGGDAKGELGLPWVLATDSAEVAEAAASRAEALAGKLRVPGARGRVHVERSEMGDVFRGVAANFAEWELFGRAAAVILSRSYFGETAAEMGRVKHAYFAPGAGCVRVDLGTS